MGHIKNFAAAGAGGFCDCNGVGVQARKVCGANLYSGGAQLTKACGD
ncbi:MAG: hypothetical protein AAF620_18705 [Bacteroidota bacterium]